MLMIVTIYCFGGNKCGEEWILDSRSLHMTPNTKFFSNYEKVDGRKVILGNDDTC